MSHSCVPNCAHSVFPNKTLALQAKHKIKAGEEFTIAYISPLQGSLKRRNKLHDKWFFDCNCPRCASPTELKSYTSTHLCPVNFWDFHCAKNLHFLGHALGQNLLQILSFALVWRLNFAVKQRAFFVMHCIFSFCSK